MLESLSHDFTPLPGGPLWLGTALHEAQVRSVDLGRHGDAVAHVPLPGWLNVLNQWE